MKYDDMIVYAIAAVLGISAIIYYAWNKRSVNTVIQNSRLLKQLHELNGRYTFNSLNDCYMFTHSFDTKNKFDRTDVDEFFKSVIERDMFYFKNVSQKASENKERFSSYLMEYHDLSTCNTKAEIKNMKLSQKKFLKIEKKLYTKHKASPIFNPDFSCTITYTSPQGRNSYRKNKRYSTDMMRIMYNDVIDRIRHRETREYKIRKERSRVTNSLRYDIMKRDGFMCCICGATSKGGAKLHIDHIIPVSKGGKSDTSNLQTLCDRCNMGKSNKM